MKKKSQPSPCPCNSGQSLDSCCGPYLQGSTKAATAEVLMRSRYTAYTCCDTHYLRATWYPSTCPENLELDKNTNPQWIRLKLVKHIPDGDAATVEFIATYKVGGRAYTLHETSRFLRVDHCWYYVDGTIHS